MQPSTATLEPEPANNDVLQLNENNEEERSKSTLTRYKAALLHFGISASLFSLVFFVLFTLWYPEPFFSSGGGWQGLKIVGSIDLVLGPLLTLIVFNTTKPKRELTTDLAIIATLQFSALLWGVYTLYQQRPVALAFYDTAFYTVTATELTEQNYALSNLSQYSEHQPPLIYVKHPKSVTELKNSIALMTDQKIPAYAQPDLYRKFGNHFSDLADLQLNMKQLRQQQPSINQQFEDFQTKSGIALEDLQFYLLKAKYQDMVLIFTHRGNVVGHLMLPPTPTDQATH